MASPTTLISRLAVEPPASAIRSSTYVCHRWSWSNPPHPSGNRTPAHPWSNCAPQNCSGGVALGGYCDSSDSSRSWMSAGGWSLICVYLPSVDGYRVAPRRRDVGWSRTDRTSLRPCRHQRDGHLQQATDIPLIRTEDLEVGRPGLVPQVDHPKRCRTDNPAFGIAVVRRHSRVGPDEVFVHEIDSRVVVVMNITANLQTVDARVACFGEKSGNVMHLRFNQGDQAAAVAGLGVGPVQHEEVRESNGRQAHVGARIFLSPRLGQRLAGGPDDIQAGQEPH